MKKICCFLFCLFLFPMFTKALICDNKTLVRYKNIAGNITTTYDYIEENNDVKFFITFSNMSSELYMLDENDKRYSSSSELILSDLKPGTSYKFRLYANNSDCETVLNTIYINLPYYNSYYKDPICDNLDYKYCNKWQKNTFTYEEFVKNVEDYRKSLEKEDDIKEKKESGIFDFIVDFYVKNYYYILPTIIVLSIIYMIRNVRKDDLF